jgi:hypothetical protein
MSFQFYTEETCTTSIGTETAIADVPVSAGVFDVLISADYDVFNGSPRWLRTTVEGETVSCSPIASVPYAASLQPGANVRGNLEDWYVLRAENTATTGMSYAISGLTASPDGYGGIFMAPSGGTALMLMGGLQSLEKSVVWISGNDIRPAGALNADWLTIEMTPDGSAEITSDHSWAYGFVLPVTIPGVLYGQNVRIAALQVFWDALKIEDQISNVRLFRQTGVCPTCYETLLDDLTVHSCDPGTNPQGCTIEYSSLSNNTLTDDSGILYLYLALDFHADYDLMHIGGAKLTLEHY